MPCSFCHDLHTVRNCTSPLIDGFIAKYDQEITEILSENIYTSDKYRFTTNSASQIGVFAVTKVHRLIILLSTTKSLVELKMIFMRMYPDMPVSSRRSKYELIANIALKTCFGVDSPFKTPEDHEMTEINNYYKMYLFRGTRRYPKEANDQYLLADITNPRNYIAPIHLRMIRMRWLNELMRRYSNGTDEDRDLFIENGIQAIIQGPVATQMFFGNLTLSEIRHWRMFRNAYYMMQQPREDAPRAPEPPPQAEIYRIKCGISINYRSEEDCAICYDAKCDSFINCKHEFCLGCVKTYISKCNQDHVRPVCPMCRTGITSIDTNIMVMRRSIRLLRI